MVHALGTWYGTCTWDMAPYICMQLAGGMCNCSYTIAFQKVEVHVCICMPITTLSTVDQLTIQKLTWFPEAWVVVVGYLDRGHM